MTTDQASDLLVQATRPDNWRCANSIVYLLGRRARSEWIVIERIAEPAAVHSAGRSRDLFSKELQVRLDGTEFTIDWPGRYLTTNGMVPAARPRHHPARAWVVRTVDCAGRGHGQAVAR